MPKKNIWDDLNDWLNTDGSPSPGGSVTRGPGDFGYRTVFPWGDRKPADAARSVAANKASKGSGRPGAWSTGSKSAPKPAPAPKSVGKGKDAPMPRKKK